MTTSPDQQVSADSSVATFTSSLIFNSAVTVGIFTIFDILRKRNRKVYEPRTYLISEEKCSEPLPSGLFAWVLPVLRVPDNVVVKRIGLDAFMFLRFMKMWAILFSIFSIFALAILLPVDFVNQGENLGLEKFTIGNVTETKRLWAHVIFTWLFSGITIYTLYREMHTYIRLRHEYYTTEEYKNSSRATTILVTGIPNELNNIETLKSLFGIFPGGVKQIWLNRDPSKLAKATAQREKLVTNLESAVTTYITQHAKDLSKSQSREPDAENGRSEPDTKRPQHSTLPIIGKKVDSLETYRTDLNNLNQQISELQKDPSKFKRLNSAFIQFNDYIGAQLAATLTIPSLNNIQPDDVIWENLNFVNTQRMIRRVISLSIVLVLVAFWATAVTFVASIATLDELQSLLPFLKGFIGKLPIQVVGIIQGILPPVALSILMFLFSTTLNYLSKFEGIVTYSGVDLSVQSKFFFFLVVNELLITSFANGVFKSLPELIKEPTKSVEILATNLPRASTFFLTFILLTITACALEISQIVPLIVNFVFKKFLVKTPRKVWELERKMSSYTWGTGFPQHIIIACIGLVYSTVQPLILPIVALHFSLYFLVYRHQFLYVYEQPRQSGGLLFPKAIYQTFTGIFIFQLTLIGLMLLKTAFAQSVLCIILLAISVGILIAMRQIFKHNPRAEFLPVDLMGVIDMKTKDLTIGKNFFTKRLPLYHKKIPSEKQQEQEETPIEDKQNEQDEHDDYTSQDVVHIEEGEEELEEEETYSHPALIAAQPTVWIPNDQNISNDVVNDYRKDGIRATNHGATLNEQQRVVIDINKVPLEFRDDDYAKHAKASKKRELKTLKKQINDIEEEVGENPSSSL